MPVPGETALHAVAIFALGIAVASAASSPAPLAVAEKIALGDVRGRIDHLALDPARHRIFVAELGNDSVGVVDLATGRVIRRIVRLDQPQGVAYLAREDTLVVANGGDGSVRRFTGADLAPGAAINLRSDADNVRVGSDGHEVIVGHGAGGLAILDSATFKLTGDIALPGHPESFQVEATGSRVFVNVPDAAQIAVVDRTTRKVIAHWGLADAAGNFAMALDERNGWLWVAYRRPAQVAVFDRRSGALVAKLPACGDADDVFVDDRRQQVYVSCGEGDVQVLGWHRHAIREVGRVRTSPGARTALFVPEMDVLVVAVPARGSEPAALWLLRPNDSSTQ